MSKYNGKKRKRPAPKEKRKIPQAPVEPGEVRLKPMTAEEYDIVWRGKFEKAHEDFLNKRRRTNRNGE